MNTEFQIEVGRTYKTKDNQTVRIVGKFADASMTHPYMGIIKDVQGGILKSPLYDRHGNCFTFGPLGRAADLDVKPTKLTRIGLWWPNNNRNGPALHLYTTEQKMANDIENQRKAGKTPIAGPVYIETTVYL